MGRRQPQNIPLCKSSNFRIYTPEQNFNYHFDFQKDLNLTKRISNGLFSKIGPTSKNRQDTIRKAHRKQTPASNDFPVQGGSIRNDLFRSSLIYWIWFEIFDNHNKGGEIERENWIKSSIIVSAQRLLVFPRNFNNFFSAHKCTQITEKKTGAHSIARKRKALTQFDFKTRFLKLLAFFLSSQMKRFQQTSNKINMMCFSRKLVVSDRLGFPNQGIDEGKIAVCGILCRTLLTSRNRH